MQKVALQNGVKRSITRSRVFVPEVRHVFFFFFFEAARTTPGSRKKILHLSACLFT